MKALHPDWSKEAIDEEVEAIRKDVQTANSFVGLGQPVGNDEDDDKPPAPTPEPAAS